MKRNWKIVVVSLFVLLGAALLCYGAFLHDATIKVPDKEKTIELVKSEPALIKLASIGGLKRDESGNIQQTFGEQEKAPKACPT